jgi:hypothetical protein
MSLNEKSIPVEEHEHPATLEPPSHAQTLPLRHPSDTSPVCVLATIEDCESYRTLTPGAGSPDCTPYQENSRDPFSAFYCHPTTRTSLDMAKCETKGLVDVQNVDLEAARRKSTNNNDCKVWPGRPKKQKRHHHNSRCCHPLRRFSKKTRLWIKILIALFVVALAVGLGVGISRAVGGGVWKGVDGQTPIPTTGAKPKLRRDVSLEEKLKQMEFMR